MDMLLMYWLPCLCMIAGIVLAARRLTHYFQLESYQFHGYFQTVIRQWKQAVIPYCALAGIYLGIFLLYTWVGTMLWRADAPSSWTFLQVLWVLLCCAGYVLAGGLVRKQGLKRKEKKKFALTARMKRFYGVLIVVLALIPVMIFLMNGNNPAKGAVSCIAAAFILPLLVALAGVVALPVERLIFHLYFRDAEKKLLENPRLIRIGITGSYGKTSTKFILAEILGQKYNVLATPASFNTPMGVTRIIRERLTPSHQVFIGEMGARHVGEIKELSRLVHPTIGLLTAVGPQHLDTFKTLERIEKTKYELIDALPNDGLSVFLHDDAIVTKLYEKTQKPKMLVGKERADAWATDVTVSPQGSHFTLHLKDWEPFACTTVLLGEHNISNILMAAAVAKHLGLNQEQIRRGILQCKPVEHRLQLLKTAGGVTVIDDAFNTNPRSSKEALKVLSSFPGRRVIVTPGMVELGAEEAKYNEEFGQAMAGAVDVAVLVGRKHTEPIKRGLEEQGFPAENIHVAANLDEAIQIVNGILKPGDVVMYENDLPDHYNEA
ncbi:MAG: UDP-N-acetylmuramoyl-tripeptide--D-alanyl-D-alanine ligase [Clostridia bacterium]|nr:UDP-N-acetylmuramoyl-tripeptide--D-alanyl-D-alanine ligase [Clostridia bacterium]